MNVAAHPARAPEFNILSLCAGVGGLELGIMLALNHLGAAGRGICYVEREIAAAASLASSMEAGWFHHAPIWADLLTFRGTDWRGLVHILASGDPCQDNSVAGKRAGKSGKRFLAPEFIRIAEECRPDLIFRENVPGNAAEQLEAITPPLERLGYRVASGIFSASETGNTMRRERLFIMACTQRFAGRAEFQAGREGCRRSRFAGISDQLARTTRERSREAGSDHSGPEERDCRAGGELDSTFSIGRDARWHDHGSDERNQSHATGQQSGQGMASTSEPRSQGQQRGQQRGQHHAQGWQVKSGHAGFRSRAILPPAVIPGPANNAGWRDLLDRYPEYQPALSQEEAESHLRRGIDAMAHRVERLRATGNGVDPVAAAYAFLSLFARLIETETGRAF